MEAHSPSSSSLLGFHFSVIPITILSILLGGVFVLLLFGDCFRRKRSNVQTIAKPEACTTKGPWHLHLRQGCNSRYLSIQDQIRRHNPFDINTLKGHRDALTALCFLFDGWNLATDGVLRVFKLDDASGKSFKFWRINLLSGNHPTAVAFADGASALVVATHALSGSSSYMYGEAGNETKLQPKLPLPEIKWDTTKSMTNGPS